MSRNAKQPGGLLRRPPASGRKPSRQLPLSIVAAIGDELMAFHHQYHSVFQRREQRHCSMFYLCGQLSGLVRKTIEPMVMSLDGPDLNAIRALQLFIGQSSWSAADAVQCHQRLVADTLGDPLGIVIVDGSGFPKQGSTSAGVAYQYCGHLGKLANCQEGVFAVYATRQGFTFLDGRLYVPERWFTDEHQPLRERCGFPEQLAFQTEPALALAMVTDLQQQDVVPFRWVAGDEHFGQNTPFLDGIAALGKWYFAEVPGDTRVWLRTPTVEPPGRGPLGRPRLHPRVAPQTPARELRAIAAGLPRAAWKRYLIKEGSRGPLWAEFAFLRVTTVRNELPGPRVWAVLRRRLSAPAELKAHLSNAPRDCAPRDLAQMCGWRWPIETSFEEAKGEVGMDHYETRSWCGWHHHMLQTFMAHLCLLRLRLRLKKSPGTDHRASASVSHLCLTGRSSTRSRHARHHRLSTASQLCRLPFAS